MPQQMPTNAGSLSLIIALAKAHKLLIGKINIDLKPLGTSFEIWTILRLLTDADGKTMSELARQADMASPTATKLIDKLVSDNIVYRRHSRSDRRVVKIFLTDMGHDIITNGGRIISDAIDQMGIPDKQLASLVSMLSAVSKG